MNTSTALSPAECRELLEGGVVGRLAMATPVGPRIVPVNYAVHGDAIVFRTAPYSELSTYGWDTDLAFEVDHIDYETHLGWSVVALGRARVVDDPDEVQRIRAHLGPAPVGPRLAQPLRQAGVARAERRPPRRRLDARDDAAAAPDRLRVPRLGP